MLGVNGVVRFGWLGGDLLAVSRVDRLVSARCCDSAAWRGREEQDQTRPRNSNNNNSEQDVDATSIEESLHGAPRMLLPSHCP